MWDVVSEGRWAPMILLAMVLAVAVAWRRSRPSKAATMLAVIAALALLLLPILNWLVVTDREAVTASLLSMEKAATLTTYRAFWQASTPISAPTAD